MLLRKIEGGLRLYDTLMKAESANFKKHLLLSPTPIESTPKVKRYKFTTKIIVWEVKKWVPPKMGTLAICWLSLGFTSFYHLSDHTNLSHPAFSVVFLSFFCFFLFDNFFLILLLISRDMQICPKGCNVIIRGSGRDICWLCSFKTVHFLDWYLYPIRFCVQCIALRTTLW